MRIARELIELIVTLAWKALGRHVEEADQINLHGCMEHPTQELGSLQFHRRFGGDACQQLVDSIAVSEAVECRVPVRVLI